ncbi:MAG: glycosyltransferase [Candidatus Micrarchaeaceae archaeon]
MIHATVRISKLNRRIFAKEARRLASENGYMELHFTPVKEPDVSVIVRARKAGRFILDALTSIANQDFDGSIETVICCPTDNDDDTLDRIYDFASRLAASSRHNISIKIVFTGRETASMAFRTGLRNSSGKYTAILDYDNLYKSNKLSEQLGFMKETGAHFSFTNYDMVDAGLNRIRFKLHKPGKDYKNFNSLLEKFYVDANTVMFDRHFKELMIKAYDVISSSLYDNLFDDYLMGFIALLTDNLNLCSRSLVLYRVSGFNSSVLKGDESAEVRFDRNVFLNDNAQKTFAALIRINHRLHLTNKKLNLGSRLSLSSKPLKSGFERLSGQNTGMDKTGRRPL